MDIEIEFDQDKSNTNIQERGISFDKGRSFNWNTALIWEDTRKDYKEPRYSAIGFIDKRLHVLVFTPRGGALRIISLRKAKR